ncbi:MAG: Holliday junction branch migration protein RuvA [Prevotellaceae bacterium]|jgi:Holliday junction DNA helicase RuvA|nr:Holliday junction branch migration protein RuvA [Prevotellaceae bacterium]
MIDYIKGNVAELTPTYAVFETGGIGYSIQISLLTYTALSAVQADKLYIYEAIREDAHTLFGFKTQKERQLFLLLISVSGIGANTARMILSSYSDEEIRQMIATGNVSALNSIKGIGAKTAQRIIVDLKDKIVKLSGISEDSQQLAGQMNDLRSEAVAALTMLGFASAPSQKAVEKALRETSAATVEQIIKMALKML